MSNLPIKESHLPLDAYLLQETYQLHLKLIELKWITEPLIDPREESKQIGFSHDDGSGYASSASGDIGHALSGASWYGYVHGYFLQTIGSDPAAQLGEGVYAEYGLDDDRFSSTFGFTLYEWDANVTEGSGDNYYTILFET